MALCQLVVEEGAGQRRVDDGDFGRSLDDGSVSAIAAFTNNADDVHDLSPLQTALEAAERGGLWVPPAASEHEDLDTSQEDFDSWLASTFPGLRSGIARE